MVGSVANSPISGLAMVESSQSCMKDVPALRREIGLVAIELSNRAGCNRSDLRIELVVTVNPP